MKALMDCMYEWFYKKTASIELLKNNTFTDNANARQYLVSSKGWIITDGIHRPRHDCKCLL